MKYILSMLFAMLLFCSVSYSQTSGAALFKDKLTMPDSVTHSRVVVNESSDVAPILNKTENSASSSIQGYRVSIFFDNKQDSRQQAEQIKQSFTASFPDIPVYLWYERPYFRVAVGNCLTKDEAVVLEGRVKPLFPNTFILNAEIPLTELFKAQDQPSGFPVDSLPQPE